MVLALFNQQLAFLQIYQTQNFLTEEAPLISMYVSRMVGKADRFRLHDSVDDALAGSQPASYRLTGGGAQLPPAGRHDAGHDPLASRTGGPGPALYYYVVPISGVLGAPQWCVSNKPANVGFTMEQGVLRMTLTGPAGEQITYSGTMQQ